MKIIATLSCIFLSFTAMACPDLTGTYFCSDNHGSYQVQYTQQVVDDITVYTISHEEGSNSLPADGKKYSEMREDQSGSKEIREIQTSCSADTLNIAYRWIYIDISGVQTIDNRLNASVSLDSKRNLQLIEKFNNDVPSTVVCDRN